ncbi:interleukin-1 receptor-associated kinase 1-binding protein 1 homolog [Polypterus senegalus]
MASRQSRVFAAVIPSEDIYRDENEDSNRSGGFMHGVKASSGQRPSAEREIQVTGTARLSTLPDRARLYLRVSSRKDSAAEAKNSVSRRLDYILMTLRQHGLQEENVKVIKDIRRFETAYCMDAEVCAIFADLEKMQNVANLFVEKLDSSVVVGSPEFYHTTENLEKVRRQAFLAAVGSAKHKAKEVCRLVNQSLGRPVIIKEEETKEWEGPSEEGTEEMRPSIQPTGQQRLQNASVIVTSKVFVSFEIKPKEKGKKHTL